MVVPKKVKFDQLQVKNAAGDAVYEAEQVKIRERKAARKETGEKLKQQDLEAKESMEKDITRNVQREIIKNKGLTRRRPKKDRNPRVKKRLKYEEMQKKRRTVVKEFKEGKQGLYKGEQSGIKTGVVAGIKM